MDAQTLIALLIVLASAGYLFHRWFRAFRGKPVSGCHTSCSACPHNAGRTAKCGEEAFDVRRATFDVEKAGQRGWE